MDARRRVRATLIAVVGLAAVVRFSRWPTPTAVLLGGGEYDPPVMYLASASLLHGLMPYRDFTFLHPPGVLLGLVPSVLIGGLFGDAVGLASARVAVVLLGVANSALVALLLKRYGVPSMLLGGGLYAGWSALAYTEQQPLLEPFLVTALLVALCLFRSRHGWAPVGMGLILGVATMVKVWAAVDLVIIAVVLLILRRFVDLGRFVLGAAVGGSAVALPFFVSAPALMWEMVVTTQLRRPTDDVDLLTRAAMFGPAPYLGHPAYQVAMALMLIGILIVAALLVTQGWARAKGSVAPVEGAIWASIALTHALVMSITGSFYDHYAMFVAAPMTLVVGAALAWAYDRFDLGRRRIVVPLVTATVLLMAGASVAGSVYRVVTTDHMRVDERVRLVDWADQFGCTWSSVGDRVLIDEVVDALQQGCTMTVDPYGENLLAQSRGVEGWRDAGGRSEAPHLAQADALVLPSSRPPRPLDEEQEAETGTSFEAAEVVGDRVLWVKIEG